MIEKIFSFLIKTKMANSSPFTDAYTYSKNYKLFQWKEMKPSFQNSTPYEKKKSDSLC